MAVFFVLRVDASVAQVASKGKESTESLSASFTNILSLLTHPKGARSRVIATYIVCKEATIGVRHSSFATDKLHSGHFGLVNTIIGLPGGVADFLLPQVAGSL